MAEIFSNLLKYLKLKNPRNSMNPTNNKFEKKTPTFKIKCLKPVIHRKV